MIEEKIYIANGKSLFDGNIVSFSLCLTDLDSKVKSFTYMYEGKEYIKLEMHKKKEKDQYNNTHFVKVNTWKPSAEEPSKKKEDSKESLPF